MARPLRVDIEDGWYHVTARGDHRQVIFNDDRDHGHFVDLLEEMRERFRVGVMAYVCMETHYHVMVRTPEANLSRAIQWLNISYSVWFNKRHQECGHVFQGRFKSVVVEDEAWGLELSQYVHLNPVRIKALGQGKRRRAADRAGVSRPPTVEEVKRRLDKLRRYRWSSYRAYAGYCRMPGWLDSEVLLARAGGAAKYRKTVEDRIRQGVEESPWEQVKLGIVLGTAEFAEKVRARLKSGREMAEKRGLRKHLGFEDVVAVVERLTGEKWGAFCERHGDKRRDLVLWVARRHTGLTLAELGRKAGGMDYAAVTMAVRRFPQACRCDRTLAMLSEKIVEAVQM
jgi:REP element-mobilizing transposase RayT